MLDLSEEIHSMLLDGSRTKSLKKSIDLARSNIACGITTKPPTDYPFLVKGKHGIKRAVSSSYKLALAKILALFPNKYIKTKHAKAMDLITARAEALKLSKKSAHKQFVVLVDDEFEVENTLSIEDKADIHATFYKGQEVKEEKGIKLSPATKTNQEPAVTKTKQETAKRSADMKTEILKQINTKEMKKALESKPSKKVAAKKAVKKVAAKKSSKDWGKQVSISIKDMRAGIKKGFIYRDPQGTRQTEAYMATRANQDYVREGMWVSKAE